MQNVLLGLLCQTVFFLLGKQTVLPAKLDGRIGAEVLAPKDPLQETLSISSWTWLGLVTPAQEDCAALIGYTVTPVVFPLFQATGYKHNLLSYLTA